MKKINQNLFFLLELTILVKKILIINIKFKYLVIVNKLLVRISFQSISCKRFNITGVQKVNAR